MEILSYICYILLAIIFIKYSFKILAFSISILKYSLWNKERTTHQNEKSNERQATSQKSFRSYISKYVQGFIFYSILETNKIPSHTIRNFIYKHIFKIGLSKNVVIYSGAEIRSPENLYLGKGTIIGHNAILDARNGIEIGSNVNFSTGVWLWTEQHNHSCPYFSCDSPKNKKITIGNRAWLGPRVIVLPGVNIGEGSVIGAGSVVAKDTEPFCIYAGMPAKKIGIRNSNLLYQFDGKVRSPFI
jgi:acetyltransferase-like isoleucine patch superfamily enzyme